jgi:hypothetical protein
MDEVTLFVDLVDGFCRSVVVVVVVVVVAVVIKA